ncbi:MAG: recombination protein O N-terminal domain-containing protein [Holosporales bacterium]|jgi:DNA repair protein RecO (recombination protein O)|nr:recombination protein O N-terminal domain-containing protein [Holosporales bacterium]
MQWEDQAIVIKSARFGESSSIVTVLSRNHGVHKGLLKRGYITIGDMVDATWTARLNDQLGFWKFDLKHSYGVHVMRDRARLNVLMFLGELLRITLTERTPCPRIFERCLAFLEILTSSSCSSGIAAELSKSEVGEGKAWIVDYLLFEFFLLEQVGFGFDFGAIDADDQYCYVSPQTGAVLSQATGEPYAHKLLKCPMWVMNARRSAVNGMRGGRSGDIDGTAGGAGGSGGEVYGIAGGVVTTGDIASGIITRRTDMAENLVVSQSVGKTTSSANIYIRDVWNVFNLTGYFLDKVFMGERHLFTLRDKIIGCVLPQYDDVAQCCCDADQCDDGVVSPQCGIAS